MVCIRVRLNIPWCCLHYAARLIATYKLGVIWSTLFIAQFQTGKSRCLAQLISQNGNDAKPLSGPLRGTWCSRTRLLYIGCLMRCPVFTDISFTCESVIGNRCKCYFIVFLCRCFTESLDDFLIKAKLLLWSTKLHSDNEMSTLLYRWVVSGKRRL